MFLQNYTVLCLIFGPKMYRTYNGTDFLPPLASLRRSTIVNNYSREMHSNRVTFNDDSALLSLSRRDSNYRSDASRELELSIPRSTEEEGGVNPQESGVSEQNPIGNVVPEPGARSIVAEPGWAGHPEPGMPSPAALRPTFTEPGMPFRQVGLEGRAEPGMPLPSEADVLVHPTQREPGTPLLAEPGMPASEPGMPGYSSPEGGRSEPGMPGYLEPEIAIPSPRMPIPRAGEEYTEATFQSEERLGAQHCEPGAEKDTTTTKEESRIRPSQTRPSDSSDAAATSTSPSTSVVSTVEEDDEQIYDDAKAKTGHASGP